MLTVPHPPVCALAHRRRSMMSRSNLSVREKPVPMVSHLPCRNGTTVRARRLRSLRRH
jgi:hypothetical protein